MQGVLDSLSALPVMALYAAMFFAAAVENVFPPIPADTIVAFGSFLAAQGQGTIVGAFLSVWVGNLTGAALMYGAGRRFGAAQIKKRLLKDKGAEAEAKLHALYDRYGMGALFLSRFVPGVRAIVPPFAGALKLPFIPALAVMGVASGLWYGLVAWLAFRVGSDWEALQRTITQYGTVAAIVAVVIVLIGVAVWFVQRRSSRAPR
jgi:membrane protein DedA with SNARE-associated domain